MTKEQALKTVHMSKEELQEWSQEDLLELAKFELAQAQEAVASLQVEGKELERTQLFWARAADAYLTLAGR